MLRVSFRYWTTGGAGEQVIYIARPRQASAVQTLESVEATCLRPRPVQQNLEAIPRARGTKRQVEVNYKAGDSRI